MRIEKHLNNQLAQKYSQTAKDNSKVIEQLGIASEVNARAVIIPMGFTGEKVASGEAELAIQQVSELMSVAGIDIAGPFPSEIQTVSTFDARANGPALVAGPSKFGVTDRVRTGDLPSHSRTL